MILAQISRSHIYLRPAGNEVGIMAPQGFPLSLEGGKVMGESRQSSIISEALFASPWGIGDGADMERQEVISFTVTPGSPEELRPSLPCSIAAVGIRPAKCCFWKRCYYCFSLSSKNKSQGIASSSIGLSSVNRIHDPWASEFWVSSGQILSVRARHMGCPKLLRESREQKPAMNCGSQLHTECFLLAHHPLQ